MNEVLWKYDKRWIGVVFGLLFPFVLFTLYWLFLHNQISFPVRFVRYLLNGHLLSNVIKLCGLGNLLIFYLALNRKMNNFSMGVIYSVFAYVILVLYVTYYHEPELY